MKLKAFLFAAAFLASEANSQNLDASAPDTISKIIRDMGYKSILKKGEDGNPFIETSANGSSFFVFFNDCEEGKNCQSLQFFYSLSVEKSNYVKIRQAADDWNEKSFFARIIPEEEQISLTYFLMMNNSGMTPDLFTKNFENWTEEQSLFQRKAYEAVQ